MKNKWNTLGRLHEDAPAGAHTTVQVTSGFTPVWVANNHRTRRTALWESKQDTEASADGVHGEAFRPGLPIGQMPFLKYS